MAFSATSQAMKVEYGLNISNLASLGNSVDYATVTLEQLEDAIGNPGDIKVTVDVNNTFFDELSNFGMQSFYFNSGLNISSANIIDSNSVGWAFLTDFGSSSNSGFNVSEFGRFDIAYRGTGGMRKDPLMFTISSGGDDLSTYALNNSKGFAFAAHIADFGGIQGGESAWFASSIKNLPPVPLPAGVWLFGSALLGFIGLSRRRSS